MTITLKMSTTTIYYKTNDLLGSENNNICYSNATGMYLIITAYINPDTDNASTPRVGVDRLNRLTLGNFACTLLSFYKQ